MNRITFILGGARSGKSRYAEELGDGEKNKAYIATAIVTDDEMRDRIANHQDRRGAGWKTVEAELDLVGAIENVTTRNAFVLTDCITVWINNLLHHGKDVEPAVDRLCNSLRRAKGHIVLVANEVGHGIVPENALARRFRDEAGRANQKIAAIADDVILISAGLPLFLKKAKQPRRKRRRAMSSRGRKD